jgi:plasmid stability protein
MFRAGTPRSRQPVLLNNDLMASVRSPQTGTGHALESLEVVMSTLVIEDVKEEAVARIATQAGRHGMSLQKEVRTILEAAARSGQGDSAMDQPFLFEADSELDSVDQLERYMYGEETTLQEWVNHFRPC